MSSIKTVTVVGLVVGVRNDKSESSNQNDLETIDAHEYNRPIVYDIDDGTGVITAVQFVKKRITHQNLVGFPSTIKHLEERFANLKPPKPSENLNKLSMATLTQKTKEAVNRSRHSFQIGTCVESKGRIQTFQGRVQLLAFSVRELNDPNQEMKRYIRLEHLKKNVYPEYFFQ